MGGKLSFFEEIALSTFNFQLSTFNFNIMDIAKIREKAKKEKEEKAGASSSAMRETNGETKTTEESLNNNAEKPVETKSEPSLNAPSDKESEEISETAPGCRQSEIEGIPEKNFQEIEIPTAEIYKKSLEGEEEIDEDYKEVLSFLVADEEFALNVIEIKEIIKLREIIEVPNTPPFIKGIISLRGEVTPIIDMRERLGLPKVDENRDTRIIVTPGEDQPTGFLVDRVNNVLKIPEKDIEPPPPLKEGIDIECINGVGHLDGRLIMILDLSELLKFTEKVFEE